MKPGIYIHIPFCKTRCTYCNFSFVVNYPQALPARYTTAVLQEIRHFNEPSATTVSSVYFGGGTPSLLEPPEIARILPTDRTSQYLVTQNLACDETKSDETLHGSIWQQTVSRVNNSVIESGAKRRRIRT